MIIYIKKILIKLFSRFNPKNLINYSLSHGLIGIVRRVDKRAYIDVALSQRAKQKGVIIVW